MDLSADGQNTSKCSSPVQEGIWDSLSDILDLNSIHFDNDECWLYETTSKHDKPVSVFSWRHDSPSSSICNQQINTDICNVIGASNKPQKAVDTRTFTRPKKKFTRPTLEQFEQIYSSGNELSDLESSSEGLKKSNDSGVYISETPIEKVEHAHKPLVFDLNQPSSSFYFDGLVGSTDIDSFQNMSPPSLVNSLCSSTFANLMESSFIKNDPVLREIRDTDYTETVLLQDTDAPLFQSITDSCSSINSDTPENFLKKVSFNGTFRRSIGKKLLKDIDIMKTSEEPVSLNDNSVNRSSNKDNLLNETLTPNNQLNKSTEQIIDEKMNQSFGNKNGTYRRTPKVNGTFRKNDPRFSTITINSTFDLAKENNLPEKNVIEKKNSDEDLNNRNSFILHDSSFENLKKRFSDQNIPTLDLNRLSYCNDDKSSSGGDTNRTTDMKRSSLGSADSLDRTSSSLSSSSKGSNRMLNMADVDAIVEMQERSLAQVMSTPKVNLTNYKHLRMLDNHFISPIVSKPLKDHVSDSEVSSNDEFKSTRSTFSSKSSLDDFAKQPAKSLAYLGPNIDIQLRASQRSNFTLANQQRPLQAIADNIRGTYSNLRATKSSSNTHIGSTQNNFTKPSGITRPPTQSNLKTMGTKLKGSYTSLRPLSANLPVAPPVVPSLDTTITMPSKGTTQHLTKVIGSPPKPVQAESAVREKSVAAGDNTFIKPQVPRASGLPRPTGIPRPASKIPGPRPTVLRPATASAKTRKQTEGYY